MTGHLFLGMPSSVALTFVEMQTQLAAADIAQLRACRLANGRFTFMKKYIALRDVSYGNKSTVVNSFGLKENVSVDFVVPII
jgi:hypothetical protein